MTRHFAKTVAVLLVAGLAAGCRHTAAPGTVEPTPRPDRVVVHPGEGALLAGATGGFWADPGGRQTRTVSLGVVLLCSRTGEDIRVEGVGYAKVPGGSGSITALVRTVTDEERVSGSGMTAPFISWVGPPSTASARYGNLAGTFTKPEDAPVLSRGCQGKTPQDGFTELVSVLTSQAAGVGARRILIDYRTTKGEFRLVVPYQVGLCGTALTHHRCSA